MPYGDQKFYPSNKRFLIHFLKEALKDKGKYITFPYQYIEEISANFKGY